MQACIIGKKTKRLMSEEKCPGVEMFHVNMEAEEIGHMCCVMQEKLHFIYMIKGAMAIQIDQERVELYRGEGLFINRGAFFRFAGNIGGGCECYLFVISADAMREMLSERYLAPVLEDEGFSYQKLLKRDEEEKKILENIEQACEIAVSDVMCPELEIKSLIYQSWVSLFRIYQKEIPSLKKNVLKEKNKLRKMLEYLHDNYKCKITLTEMAEYMGISGGDYCRFFKKHMGQTPFEYLQTYRIEMTIPELLKKTASITDLSLKNGFNGSSYYAETFRKEMGCTPGVFRKWYLGEEEGKCPLKIVQVGSGKTDNKENVSLVTKKASEEMPMHLL